MKINNIGLIDDNYKKHREGTHNIIFSYRQSHIAKTERRVYSLVFYFGGLETN